MSKVKLGLIGLGNRGINILNNVLLLMDDVEITAVCDSNTEKVQETASAILTKKGYKPLEFTCCKDLFSIEEIDAVFISTGWSSHISISIQAMRAGKYAAFEVGGAYSIDDCRKLVDAYEETGIPCMMMENCCYGRNELMALNMVKKGLFGEIVHCSGGYHHDLRQEDLVVDNPEHYRLKEYIYRNCENYPTHELGPIAKVLNINRGNRMISLTSTASKASGLHSYICDTKGADSSLAKIDFKQGDIIITVIKCANGQTITLTLDTTLPRPYYSRALQVRGVKGMYTEETNTVFIEGETAPEPEPRGNGDEYRKRFEHPIWREYIKRGMKGGHGGIDWLVFRAFIESVKSGSNTPIDAYDAAAWMSISTLSEQSIACGSMPVEIPDFTNGKWIMREPIEKGIFCLDEICEDWVGKAYDLLNNF